MTSWLSPRAATSARYSGRSSAASSIDEPRCRSSIVSNSGTMPTGLYGSAPDASSRPASFSSIAASSMSDTDWHIEMM